MPYLGISDMVPCWVEAIIGIGPSAGGLSLGVAARWARAGRRAWVVRVPVMWPADLPSPACLADVAGLSAPTL